MSYDPYSPGHPSHRFFPETGECLNGDCTAVHYMPSAVNPCGGRPLAYPGHEPDDDGLGIYPVWATFANGIDESMCTVMNRNSEGTVALCSVCRWYVDDDGNDVRRSSMEVWELLSEGWTASNRWGDYDNDSEAWTLYYAIVLGDA